MRVADQSIDEGIFQPIFGLRGWLVGTHVHTRRLAIMTLEGKVREVISEFQLFSTKEDNNIQAPSPQEFSRFIDHTLLKPEATDRDILALCIDAVQHHFKTVCVNSSWISTCVQFLSDISQLSPGKHRDPAPTPPVPIAVVGFPLGAGLTESKAGEARLAIEQGAKEIDMVMHVGRLRGGHYEYVFEDIKAVYDTCGQVPLKVILETSLLTRDEIIAACYICKEVGVAFVKTSTGFAGGGAKVEDVALMKAVVGEGIEVKASGSIRTYEDAVKMWKAGATRIGASASVAIVRTKI